MRQVFGPLFGLTALLAAVQLGFGARLRGRRGRIRSRVNALVLVAGAARAAYFGLEDTLAADVVEQLFDVFYPVVLSGFALTTAFLAECYHARRKLPGRCRCRSLHSVFGLSAVETSSTYGAMVFVLFGLLTAKILAGCLHAPSSAWQLRIAVYAVLVVLSTMCTLAFWVYSLEFFQTRMGRPNHWRERCGLISAAVFQLFLIGLSLATLFSVADRSPLNPHVLLLGHVLEFAICVWWIGVLWLPVPFSTSPPAPALWILSPNDCASAEDDDTRPAAPVSSGHGHLARLLGERLRLRGALLPPPAGRPSASHLAPVQEGPGAGAAPASGAAEGEVEGEDEEVAPVAPGECSAGEAPQRLCWICYEHNSQSHLLRRPCACAGTMSAVHDCCLREWLRSQTGSGFFPTRPRCSVRAARLAPSPSLCATSRSPGHCSCPSCAGPRPLPAGVPRPVSLPRPAAPVHLCARHAAGRTHHSGLSDLLHSLRPYLPLRGPVSGSGRRVQGAKWAVCTRPAAECTPTLPAGTQLLLSLLLVLNEFALVMFFGPHISRLFHAARAEAWRFVPYEPSSAYGACDSVT